MPCSSVAKLANSSAHSGRQGVSSTRSVGSTSPACHENALASLIAGSGGGADWCQGVEVDLAELLSLPGVEEFCVLRSTVGFMALHGGSQDRGTHEIACRAAEQAGGSYYAIVQPSAMRAHLTSRSHNPDQSERLRAFLRHVKIAISIHGYGRDLFRLQADPVQGIVVEPYGPALHGRQTGPFKEIILGGRNADFLEVARRLFFDRFEGYCLGDERIRLGFDPDNPVNLPSAQGVQVELPPGLRGIGEFGEQLVPRQDGIVTEVIAGFVELAGRAGAMVD
jgi:phage replication-related protein YjqB (UPF0714/DUF867 family)